MSTTESASNYKNLDKLSVKELLTGINSEDFNVPSAIKKQLPQIESLVTAIVEKMRKGGRLFYIGAGTSGRLGILDASEIPPTYGVKGKIIGLIAGGDTAIRTSVEKAEDDIAQAWKDIAPFQPTADDVVLGIAASGRTPYVIGGVKDARTNGLITGCITCNAGSELAAGVDFPVEVVVGPEFVTGSTRMKSGTAQKLVLNMISTTVMIQLGRVVGDKMVDMQLSNIKLVGRGARMVSEELGIDLAKAEELLRKHGSVRKAIDSQK